MSLVLPSIFPTTTIPPATASPATTTPLSDKLLFQLQFAQALSALNKPAGSTATSPAGSAFPAAKLSVAASSSPLIAALQKKIAAMLAQGTSVTDIVNQLSTSLANQFASSFGGDPAQIRSQLQSIFAQALAPPGNGPPATIADTASALAQRFRQIADVAARVGSGETGQPNRLFAGSNSDAATTAGVQPAPSPANGNGQQTADSIRSALPGTSGDGKTVATNGTATLGLNGDTPLGRILARALQSQQPAPAPQPASQPVPQPASPATSPQTPNSIATLRAASIVASATAALGSGSTDPSAGPTAATTSNPATLNPALGAFLTSFSDALAAGDSASAIDPQSLARASDSGDPSAPIGTSVTSAQAPTIGAFAPVFAPFAIDSSTNGAAPSSPATPSPSTWVDPNSIVDQVLRGAFLQTNGSSSEVRLKLVPEALGDVTVKLNVDGANVSATLVANTPDARDALLAGQNQLTRALADAGLKLTSFNVDLGGSFAGFQQQQQQSLPQQSAQGRPLTFGSISDAVPSEEEMLLAMPSFGPPLVGRANLGALNYLA